MTPSVVGLLGRCYSVPFILPMFTFFRKLRLQNVRTYLLPNNSTNDIWKHMFEFLTSKEAMACRRVGSVMVVILIGKQYIL